MQRLSIGTSKLTEISCLLDVRKEKGHGSNVTLDIQKTFCEEGKLWSGAGRELHEVLQQSYPFWVFLSRVLGKVGRTSVHEERDSEVRESVRRGSESKP